MTKLINNIFFTKNNMIDNNSYVVICKDKAVVIDPSWNFDKINKFLIDKKIKNIIVMLTHGHYDHVGDISLFKIDYEVDVFISKHEEQYLVTSNSKRPFSTNINLYQDKIKFYEDYKSISVNDSVFNFLNVPGHSIGSTCIFYNDCIFTGDFVFSDCIGRIDLLTSSFEDMNQSILNFNKIANDNFLILPGHGNWVKFKTLKEINNEYNSFLEYEKK